MSTQIFCDVIGCENAAAWKCPPRTCKILDDYLCAIHYAKLQILTPITTQQYERIEGVVVKEATEECIGVENKKGLIGKS